jgi:outer membrane lipase/esterase
VPDLGKAPAILAQGAGDSLLATTLVGSMNNALLGAIAADPGVKLFDLFDLIDSIVTNPGDFGLTNVTDACAQFVSCNPSNYLFWDGIHPTSAGHAIISEAMLSVVPEPSALALILFGLVAIGAFRVGQRCRREFEHPLQT